MNNPERRATRTGRLCFMLALCLCIERATAEVAAESATVDRQSGVAFPNDITPPGGGISKRLTGTATREPTIFRVNVYAYGLHVDADAARRDLAIFKGRTADSLDRAFFQRLLEMRIPMTMRLVMTRDIAGEAFGNAFDDALKPRVASAANPLNRTDGAAALERFRSYFNLRELGGGTEFAFSCSSGGRLNTAVGTQPRSDRKFTSVWSRPGFRNTG